MMERHVSLVVELTYWFYNSTIYSSAIDNSAIDNSAIDNSSIHNSTICNSCIYIFDDLLHMLTQSCVAATSDIVPLSAGVELEALFSSSIIVWLASVPVAESGDYRVRNSLL